MIKLITFDLDNTLWDVVPTIVAAEKTLRAWLTQRVPGYAEQVTPELMATLREQALQADPQLRYNISDLRILLLQQALLQCGLPADKAATTADDAFDIFMQGRNTVEFYPDALEVVAELARSYRLVALTNGNADISVMPLATHFEFSMSPDVVQSRKPEAKIFTETLKQASRKAPCLANEVIHVGDNLEEDIDGAKQAGWHSVWVNINGEPAPAQPYYSQSVSRLQDLPAAIRKIDATLP